MHAGIFNGNFFNYILIRKIDIKRHENSLKREGIP